MTIKATVKHINPRTSKEMQRVGYGETEAEALKQAVAGRRDWTITSCAFERDDSEVVVTLIENEEELQKIWSSIHYGK